MKLYIGFSDTKKFHVFSWFIKLVEGTQFSHTYIRIKSENLKRELIYQASGLCVNFSNKECFEEDHIVVEEFEVEISQETYIKVLQFAIDNVGIPYSLRQCVGLLWIRFMSRLGRKASNPMKDGRKGEICTQLVAEILKECLNFNIDKDIDSIGVQEAYNYAKQLKKANNG